MSSLLGSSIVGTVGVVLDNNIITKAGVKIMKRAKNHKGKIAKYPELAKIQRFLTRKVL